MMKQIFSLIFLFLALFTAHAQRQFEGIITYDVIISDGIVKEQNYVPKQQKSYFKEGKVRMEMKTTDVEMTIIGNDTNENAAFLFNFMGMKMAVNTTKDDLIKLIGNDKYININYTKEKKTIAGYSCIKAHLDFTGGQATLYVCDKLPMGDSNWLINSNISGAIMQFNYRDGNDNISIVAREVKKTELNSDFFKIPSDYMQMSHEDIKSMLGSTGASSLF